VAALPPEAGPFLAAIIDDPDAAETRLVFADWLEERGLTGPAAAQRWLAAGNRPFSTNGLWTWFAWSEERVAYWRDRDIHIDGLLPRQPVVTPVGQPVHAGVGPWWDFDSRSVAELALTEAWPDV
jgi:uncharacterized protein (TIGR02996 family)